MATSSFSNLPSPKQILLSPFLSGPLLLYLTKINPDIVSKIPWPPERSIITLPFSLPFGIPNQIPIRADPPVKALKALFGLGLILYLNRFFNRLALNYGHLKKQGTPWDFQTEGKETIIITGGCSGFGKEMVKQFATQTKAKILVLDIQELPEELKDIPRLTYYQIDLSSPESIKSVVSTVLAEHRPTVLINNAGIAQAHTILDTTDEFLDKIFRINVTSHFTLIRLLLPRFMSQSKGHIVTIASMASYTGTASLADYSATKAAVLGMHESLLQELAHRHQDQGGHTIQASIIHPLWARTPLIGSWETQLTRSGESVMTAEFVAAGVVKQVLGGRSGSVYLPEHNWNVVFMRAVPTWLAFLVQGKVQRATNTGQSKK
ncbi:hypothetical protein B0A52_01166 [Exophiala mesophila]|uniref:Uncharacterized protein n=1 Tax=Exophiala mesophila TaxID=212818 RepID=A0A438NGN2_EXOME|nr:hypothetical protein B0A52_01166 [Exophiala mesophila]